MIDVNASALSGLIGGIYDSAYDPARWSTAVASLQDLFQGSKACIQRYGPDVGPNDAVATNADAGLLRLYVEEFAQEPNTLAEAIRVAEIGSVYLDHALVGGDRLRCTRFWNEWMAPQDMYGGIGCRLMESGSSFWFVDVQRGQGQEAFDANDIALMQTITPHLTRATQMSRTFQSSRLLASTFSYLPFGVILVDGFMRIACMNDAAEAVLLRSGTGLLRKSGQLAAVDEDTMVALQRLIERACTISADIIPGVGGDLLVRKRRDGEGVDLALSIAPVVNPLHEMPFLGRHAAIFVREISFDIPAGFTAHIRAIFDLSPQEAGLAASLASGHTLKKAAEDQHIQISTARSYLEKIFQKTRTRQQSQLVALLKSTTSIT
jgi:DNA-binding CsgD family transcriptional regulator